MTKLLRFIKSISIPLLLILVLHTTGLLSTVTVQAQSLLLRTGLLNAHPEPITSESFPYDFDLTTIAGETISMDSLKGKVVFLNLWATWCGPCRAEMPAIQQLYQSLPNKKMAFVMLSIDKKGEEAKINKYLENQGFTFPVYRPTFRGENSIPEMLKVPSIPTTFVIDKEGNVVYKNVGTANYHTKKFSRFLEDLLNK
jgi:thiol-disulfide isomerase/thioredoxin